MERAGKNCLSLVLTDPFSKLCKVLPVTPDESLSKFEFKKWLFAMNFRIQDSETKKILHREAHGKRHVPRM